MTQYVYAIRAAGYVKIGISANPILRLNKIQSDCPFPATLESMIEGDVELEQSLHKRFRKYLAKGEWYECQGEVLSWLQNLPKHKAPEQNTTPLQKWLNANKMTKTDFAKAAGVSRMHLWRILNGDNSLSVSMLEKVSIATDGKVKVAELLPREAA